MKENKEIDDCRLREPAKKSEEMTDEMGDKILPENRDMVNEFLRNNPQLADKTLPQYRSGLGIFFYWNAEFNKNKPFYKITKRDYLSYQSHLMERGFSSSALRFKKSTVSSLNNYIENVVSDDMEECKGFKNFCRGLPSLPQNKVYEKKPLNREEYEKLVTYLTEKEDWKKLAYLEFSYSSACRKSEARQLLKEVVNYKPIIKGTEDNPIIYYITHPIECKGSKRNSNKIKPLSFDYKAMATFKKWMEKQPYEGQYLDKDILKQGNQIYGPEHCAFLPQKINALLISCTSAQGIYPVGVTERSGRFIARVQDGKGSRKYLGRFPSPELAHKAWQLGKAAAIEVVIKDWCGEDTYRQDVAEALYARCVQLRSDAEVGILTTFL